MLKLYKYFLYNFNINFITIQLSSNSKAVLSMEKQYGKVLSSIFKNNYMDKNLFS